MRLDILVNVLYLQYKETGCEPIEILGEGGINLWKELDEWKGRKALNN